MLRGAVYHGIRTYSKYTLYGIDGLYGGVFFGRYSGIILGTLGTVEGLGKIRVWE